MAEDVTIQHGSTPVEAYLAGDGGPGVLLFMDAIGLRPQIAEMVDRIAGWGCTVLAPNLFWRDGTVAELAPQGDLRDPEQREAFFGSGVMDRVQDLTPERVLEDAAVWLAELDRRVGTAGPVATVGYCFGGRLALRTAAAWPDRVGLVGMFHTGGIVTDDPDSPHLVVPDVRAFVLAGHADHDRSNGPEQVAAFDEALTEAGVAHRTAVYEDAPHGFTMADTSSYDAAAAARHDTELRAAIEEHLHPA